MSGESSGLVVRLRVRTAGGEQHDVSLRTRDGASVRDVAAELAARIGTDDQAVVTVDGLVLPADARWRDVAPTDGSVVHIDGRSEAAPGSARYELAVIGGPLAGGRFPLRPGTMTMGRGSAATIRLADPQVSREHLKLSLANDSDAVRVEDLGSSNRTLIDGELLSGVQFVGDDNVLTVGGSLVAVRRVPDLAPPSRRAPGSARRVVQRPPRQAAQPPPRPTLVAPAAPTPPRRLHVPWAAVALPLVASGVIVYATGRYIYLLFAVLSPLIVLINALSEARARRAETRARTGEYQAARTEFARKLAEASMSDARYRRSRVPDLAQLHAAATIPTARLWERTPEDADFLSLLVGSATQVADIQLRDSRSGPEPAPELLDLPVVVDLRVAGVLGISGERTDRDGAARGLLAQLAVLHSPADLRIAVLTSPQRAAAWDWVKWLPHTTADPSDGGGLVALDRPSSERIVSSLLAAAAPAVVVVDEGETVADSPAVARLLLEAPAAGVCSVVLANRFTELPRACRATLDLDRAAVHDAAFNDGTSSRYQPLRWDALALDRAVEIAAALSGWADPQSVSTTGPIAGLGLPAAIGFLDSLGSPDLSVAAIVNRWRSPGGTVPTALCGMGESGPVAVDLRSGHGGPNAFVAGTVGSGKSDFLRSLLVSLAISSAPDELAMVLIDFKEGSGLEVLAALPHVAGLLTNEERGDLPRLLTALSAERAWRQQRLKAAGFDSFDQSQAATPGRHSMPRLLIVVDEFAALRQSVPDAMDRLVDIVRKGRAAGMHLLLSTQTITTSVGSDIIDNTTLHVCLRVENESESRTLIGSPAAAAISPAHAGRGYVSDGQSVRAFQSGWLGQRTPEADTRVVVAEGFRLGSGGLGPAEAPAIGPGQVDPTDMERVLDALRSAAGEIGVPHARPAWEPPLPELLTLDEVTGEIPAPAPDDGLAIPLGLLDAPAQRTRLPWTVRLDEVGHFAVIGGSRSGRSTLLRTFACAATLSAEPGGLHVYVIDGSGHGLADLEQLPTTASVVAAEDRERLMRLFRVLDDEVRRRQRLIRDRAASFVEINRAEPTVAPHVVVLVDGFEALHDDAQTDGDNAAVSELLGLLRDGPAVGVHVVLTTDGSMVHTRVVSSIGARFVLRLPEVSQYVTAGLPRDLVPLASPPPGRGIWSPTGLEGQVALLDPDPSGSGQTAAVRRIAQLAGTLVEPDAVTRVPVWRGSYPLADLADGLTGWSVVLGVGGDQLLPRVLPLQDLAPALLVTGPRRSGRSTTLACLAVQLLDRAAGRPGVALVTPRRGPLRELADQLGAEHSVGDLDQLPGLVDHVASAAAPMVVLVDDGDRLMEPAYDAAMTRLLALAGERGHLVVLAGSSAGLTGATRPWVPSLRRSRNVLMLRSTSRNDVISLGLTPGPRMAEPAPAAGRGLLFVDGDPTYVHVADPTLG